MVNERAGDLAAFCTELMRKGEDFPTVWTSVLNSNALVIGLPESKLEGKRPAILNVNGHVGAPGKAVYSFFTCFQTSAEIGAGGFCASRCWI